MNIKSNNFARILSEHIKQNPQQFNAYISSLVDAFMLKLDLNITDKDMQNLSIAYMFIFMYALIIGNFSTITNIMRYSVIIHNIIASVITNENLKLRQHLELVNTMVSFGKEHHSILNSNIVITHCCLHFRANTFYKAMKQVAEGITNNNISI